MVTILAYTGLRFGELTGLNVEDVDLAGAAYPCAAVHHAVVGSAHRGTTEEPGAGRRSVPMPRRLMPILERRTCRASLGSTSYHVAEGSRLGLDNWKRSVRWRDQDARTRPADDAGSRLVTHMRLWRDSSGADMKLLQVTMGHASIMVTAHTYADLYDSDLDRVADALDGLGG